MSPPLHPRSCSTCPAPQCAPVARSWTSAWCGSSDCSSAPTNCKQWHSGSLLRVLCQAFIAAVGVYLRPVLKLLECSAHLAAPIFKVSLKRGSGVDHYIGLVMLLMLGVGQMTAPGSIIAALLTPRYLCIGSNHLSFTHLYWRGWMIFTPNRQNSFNVRSD
jgi:hypothetical protein